MQWKESLTVIGAIATITVGSTFAFYNITEKRIDRLEARFEIMDAKWEKLFERMDAKLERMDDKWERLLLKDQGK